MSSSPARPVGAHADHTLVSGAGMALLAQILVGSSFAALYATRHFPFGFGHGTRYLVGAGIMVLVARGRVPLPTFMDVLRVSGIAGIGMIGFNVFVIQGATHSDAASVGVVVGCTPIVLVVVSALQRRVRPHPMVLIAAVVVAVGAGLVQGGGVRFSLLGFLFALGALGGEAAFTLLAVPSLARLGAVGVSVWTCVAAGVMLIFWGIMVEVPALRTPELSEFLIFLWMAVAITATAFLCWYGAVYRLGTERAGLFLGILPVSAAVVAVLSGTGSLAPLQILGTALVAGGVTFGMAASGPRRASRSPSTSSIDTGQRPRVPG